MMKITTREIWLEAAIVEIAPIFAKAGYAIPVCKVSCGFTSTGVRSGHIGQCWSKKSSSDGVNQIFISPALEDPLEVLDTLVHELVHAVDDCKSGHGEGFKKIATDVGLIGPMRSAGAGQHLKQDLIRIAQALGHFPHARLLIARGASRAGIKRPGAKCAKCGYEIVMMKRYLQYGPPICPKDQEGMEETGEWNG
jgi:hypothetical protein